MTAVPVYRPPLGLPPGSIRAILAIQIVAIFWMMLLVPTDHPVPIPLNLYFLLSLVLLFFVSHGKSYAGRKSADGTRSGAPEHSPPLGLPAGTVAVFLIGGSIAILVYLYLKHPDHFARLTPAVEQIQTTWSWYFGAYVVGFVAGLFVKLLPFRHGWIYQTFQAWAAIIAMAILLIDMIFQVLINVTLEIPVEALAWRTAVTGIVAFYFGSRS